MATCLLTGVSRSVSMTIRQKGPEWNDLDSALVLPVAFAQRMAQHQTLLLGVTAFRDDLVRDRFNLTGTAAMLEQIDCRAE